jgi:hypothetical protein
MHAAQRMYFSKGQKLSSRAAACGRCRRVPVVDEHDVHLVLRSPVALWVSSKDVWLGARDVAEVGASQLEHLVDAALKDGLGGGQGEPSHLSGA